MYINEAVGWSQF